MYQTKILLSLSPFKLKLISNAVHIILAATHTAERTQLLTSLSDQDFVELRRQATVFRDVKFSDSISNFATFRKYLKAYYLLVFISDDVMGGRTWHYKDAHYKYLMLCTCTCLPFAGVITKCDTNATNALSENGSCERHVSMFVT